MRYLALLLMLAFAFSLVCCSKHDSPAPRVMAPIALDKTPKLVTGISGLTHFSVIFGAQVLSPTGLPFSEMGFVVDTVPGPTTTKNFNKFVIQQFDSTNHFLINVDAVPSNVTYYVRAYAIDTFGIGYGNEVKFTSLGNNIYKGNVTLATQQQVIDFGASHYTGIDGDLNITGSATDLTPLLGLSFVNYAFNVQYSSLVNFKGLDSLEMTGAYFANGFTVQYNNNLLNFTGLGKLKMSNGYTQIYNNPALQSFDGLDSYVAANAGTLYISTNNSLQNLNGLKKMSFVGEDLYIMFEPNLTDLAGLSALTSVYGRLYIENNAGLRSLHGLEGVVNPDGGVELDYNPLLGDISALSNLTSFAGSDGAAALFLTGNPMIKDLSAFSKLTTVPFVTIDDNNGLRNLSGLSGLKSVGYLEIAYDSGMTDLTGMTSLTSLNNLKITDNPLLVNLHGLEMITAITGNAYSISVARNNGLVSLSGLDNLRKADGTIQFFSNPVLTDFCPLKLLFNSGYTAWFYTEYDGANPTQADVMANCH